MADDFTADELAIGALESGDVVLGSDNAPVTILAYVSTTSRPCAHFQATTFPELKKRYIDTGKVRYAIRPFTLNQVDLTAWMLAPCAGKDKYQAVIETLLAKQSQWMVQQPMGPLIAIAEQLGFTKESLTQCLANQERLQDIQRVSSQARIELGVDSTPTFFVNGKRLVGDLSIDQIAKEVDPYLKQG